MLASKQINFNNSREVLTEQDLEAIWKILAKGLRSKNSRLIWVRLQNDLLSIPYHGILERLIKESYGWSYCAGQSYPDEIRTIREIIYKLK